MATLITASTNGPNHTDGQDRSCGKEMNGMESPPYRMRRDDLALPLFPSLSPVRPPPPPPLRSSSNSSCSVHLAFGGLCDRQKYIYECVPRCEIRLFGLFVDVSLPSPTIVCIYSVCFMACRGF